MIRTARIRTIPRGVCLHAHVTPGPPPDADATIPLRPVRTTTSSHTFELFGYYRVHSDDEMVLNEIADAVGAELSRHAAAGLAHIRAKNALVDPIRTITGQDGDVA